MVPSSIGEIVFAAIERLPKPNIAASVFDPTIKPVLAAMRFPTVRFEFIDKSGVILFS